MNLLLNKKQRGIGLLELMLSLAIIAILLIMATRYYGAASRSEKVNEGVALVQNIAAASAQWKAGHANYDKITAKALIESGMIPKQYVDTGDINTGTTIITPWPGVTVSSLGPASKDNSQKVKVEMSKFSGDYTYACNNLAQKFKAEDPNAKCSGGTFTVTFD